MPVAVVAANQITRYKTSLEWVGNGDAQVDDLSNCLLSPQVQLNVKSGRISPNNWQKHPIANLPASDHEILI